MPATSKSLCAPLLESMVSGVPGILLAATPATATLTSGAGTLALSAAHPGNIPLGLKLVQSPGANAALSVVDGTGLVTVNLATDSGNAGSAVIANGSVVTLKKILSIIPVGIWFALHHEDSLWMESEVYPTPLYPLRQAGVYQSGIYNGFDATGYLLVELGTNAGSPAYVTVAGDTGSYTLGATAGSPGVWPHGKVRIRHIGSGADHDTCYAVAASTSKVLSITVYLPVGGDASPATAADVTTAINTALGSATGDCYPNVSPWLAATSPNSGHFTSDLGWTTITAHGVDPAPDSTKNTEALIRACLSGGSSVVASMTVGTGPISAEAIVPFMGRGANPAVTTTLQTLHDGLAAYSAMIIPGAVFGGSALCVAGTTSLTGGTNTVYR